MSPRNLFNIILKVIGIFCLKDILLALPNFLPVVYYGFETLHDNLIAVLFLVLGSVIYLLTAFLLLFKTGWLIDNLQLESGIKEESLNINLHRSIILSVTILIVGWLLIIDTLPTIIGQIIVYWQTKSHLIDTNLRFIVVQLVKLLIGIFLVIGVRPIVNFIELRRATTPQPDSSTNQGTHPSSE